MAALMVGWLRVAKLWRCEIRGEGAKWIGEGLKCNSSLVHLDLRENEIGPEGEVHLAEALSRNSSLLNCLGVNSAEVSRFLSRNEPLEQEP